MEKLTKEKAIELYLKMVASENSIVYGGRIELYLGKKIVATAQVMEMKVSPESKLPCALYICPSGLGGDFELTKEEYDEIESKTENILYSKSEEILTKMIES